MQYDHLKILQVIAFVTWCKFLNNLVFHLSWSGKFWEIWQKWIVIFFYNFFVIFFSNIDLTHKDQYTLLEYLYLIRSPVSTKINIGHLYLALPNCLLWKTAFCRLQFIVYILLKDTSHMVAYRPLIIKWNAF